MPGTYEVHYMLSFHLPFETSFENFGIITFIGPIFPRHHGQPSEFQSLFLPTELQAQNEHYSLLSDTNRQETNFVLKQMRLFCKMQSPGRSPETKGKMGRRTDCWSKREAPLLTIPPATPPLSGDFLKMNLSGTWSTFKHCTLGLLIFDSVAKASDRVVEEYNFFHRRI